MTANGPKLAIWKKEIFSQWLWQESQKQASDWLGLVMGAPLGGGWRQWTECVYHGIEWRMEPKAKTSNQTKNNK